MATFPLNNGAAELPVYIVNPATGLRSQGLALVDSGDQIVLCNPALAQAVGAIRTNTDSLEGVVGQPVSDPQYTLDLDLGPAGYVANATLIGQATGLGYAILIGQNALGTGVFLYDGPGGTFTLDLGISAPPPSSNRGLGIAAIVAAAVGVIGLGIGLALEHEAERGRRAA